MMIDIVDTFVFKASTAVEQPSSGSEAPPAGRTTVIILARDSPENIFT
jgi:hypothetical protein